MKICIKCFKELPKEQFSKSQSRCKACCSEYWKNWADTHKEKLKEKERVRCRTPERQKAKKEGYMRNRQTYLERKRRNDNYRRAWKQGAVVSRVDWNFILDYYGYCCVYCFSSENLTMEHIVPLSRGGSHTVYNIAPACQHCNSSKNKKTPLEFLRVQK